MSPPVSSPEFRRHAAFHSDFLPDDRDVTVWLPPGYDDDPSRRYPVLYLHDGQNLFDPDTAFVPGQTWQVGDTAGAEIAAARVEPLIIVGIANAGSRRIQEYTPTPDSRLGGGLADQYGRLIVDELKPLVDRTYRTLPDPMDTAIGGSSLGGLVSLYLALTRPQTFGRVAVMSPSVWWDRRAILRTVRGAQPKPRLRLWVDIGTAEGRRGLDDARLLKAALVGAGWVVGGDLHYAEYEGATHSEGAWAARFAPVLRWLFGVAGTSGDLVMW
jgi:predicted alpha/beta superfamily hydrolase